MKTRFAGGDLTERGDTLEELTDQSRLPGFWSLALLDIPAPDYADVALTVLPPGSTTDPRVWAETLFSRRSLPVWVAVAFVLRQLLAPLIGVRTARRGTFDVARVEGDEALISVDDRHLSFRCGVGVDSSTRLVRVVTTVRLNGFRGRAYFLLVRLAHPTVVAAMLSRAQRQLCE